MAELLEPSFTQRGDTYYDPCYAGLHLCGYAFDARGEEQPYTALNIPAPDAEKARLMFARARDEAVCPFEEADFVCDLNVGNRQIGVEHEADFYTNRQLVDRLVRAALSTTPPVQTQGEG